MGIKQLMKLITEEAPGALKEKEMENLNDRKVAIDASMAIYQFLVAVRSSGPGGGQASMQLTNENGDVTSHIQGMFNRTIKMMETGVKPLYVFDGKPPQLKGGELAKRLAKRAKAEADLAVATEAGETDDIDKYSRRLVKATRQHSDECKELLALMGVPFMTAPCEAEAQCAELAKKGKVYATATEDMDALTFRTPKLLRKFTSSQGKEKQPIIEVDFNLMLEGLGLTYEQFVDLCILCGCDYCSTIKGVGAKTALKLIKQHGTIEKVIVALRKEKKYDIPADWQPIKVSKRARLQAEAEAKAEADAAAAKAEADAAAQTASGSSSSSSSSSATASASASSEAVVGEATDGAVAMAVENGEQEVAGTAADVKTGGTEPTVEAEEKENTNSANGGVAPADVETAPTAAVEATVEVPVVAEVEVPVVAAVEVPVVADVEVAAVSTEAPLEAASSSSSSSSSEVAPGAEATNDEDEPEILVISSEGDAGDGDDEYEIIEPLYVQARFLFIHAEVTPAEDVELKWEEPKEEALKQFLCERMGFSTERVASAIVRLQTAHRKKSQKRMDSFFTISGTSSSSTHLKRKQDEQDNAGKDKKAKPGKATGGAKKSGFGSKKR